LLAAGRTCRYDCCRAAAPANDRTTCSSTGSDKYKQNEFIDVAWRACDRLISSRKYSGKELALLLRTRGYWSHQKGDFDTALADFDRAISLEPNNVENYDYRADTWLAKGELDRAIADHDRAIRINPRYIEGYCGRGSVYEKKGQIDLAIADYKAALALPAKDRNDEWAQNRARERLKALGAGAPSG
jgi:tetratricopeptide (TPR) repeat protein